MNFSQMKKMLAVAVAGIVFGGIIPANVMAASSAKEGARCSKAGVKVKASKKVTLVCTKSGTKTKVLRWRRSVPVAKKPKAPAVTTTVPSSTMNTKIVIKDYSYVVASNIKKGDVLSIGNLDSVTHTVTFDTNSVDAPADNSVGGYSVKTSKVAETTKVLFDVSVPGNSRANLPSLDVGTYKFYCTLHSTMRGVLTIR
jgi:plastocyanin